MAQALAAGMSATDAYANAGYAPSRQHASRLATKGDINARVAELQAAAAERTVTAISFDAVAMFARLEQEIQDAKAAGDHKAAMDGRKFMLKAFGYEDHPTLTHEHVRGSKLTVNAGGVAPTASPDQPPSVANANRFLSALKKYQRPAGGS
jgi:hypothetical protein